MFLTNRMRLFLSATAVLSLASAADEGYADQTTPMEVLATVEDACTFEAVGTLSFGIDYVPGQTGTQEAEADFDVSCTVATNATIAIDKGENPLGPGNTRQMDDGNGGLLQYVLHNDTLGNPWGDGNVSHPDPVQNFAFGTLNTVTVVGQLPPAQTPPGGAYSDTVNLTMSF